MASEDTGYVDVEILDDPEDKDEKKQVKKPLLDDDDEAEGEGTETSSTEDHDDEHAEGEEETHAEAETGDETDDEREAIRARRRQERQDRKNRVKEREETLRRELSSRDELIGQLSARLDAIDNRNTGSELAQIENAKQEAVKAYNYFKDQIRIGTESNNGSIVAEATEKMIVAQNRYNDLGKIETAYKQRKTQPQPLDSRIANHAQKFVEGHKWYKPTDTRDADSRVVLALDQTLAEEGFNPTTPQYWEELESRIKKYLPHRVLGARVIPKPKSVVQGSGRETGSSSGKTTFRLSAERVQAIKELGDWDDPVARNKHIREYRDWDKTNKSEGN